MEDSSPLCFTQLSGQEKAKRLLGRSISTNRVPHAYLFKGPEGVGKRLFARGIAAAINCHEKDQIEACGVCLSCRKIRSMNHPDFMVIGSKKGMIKIDQIRRMSREISSLPYESPMRIVVLEDVHAMRREAANSLLKTLEEPSDNNLLILTADSSREILATLSSRCQIVPFLQLCIDDTAALLVRHGIDPKSALLLAKLSEGSPGKALLLHKMAMVPLWQELVAYLSDPGVDVNRDVGRVLQFAAKMAQLKQEVPRLLGLLKIWLRDILLVNLRDGVVAQGNGSLTKDWNSSEIYARLQAIDMAERELLRNCNRDIVCEVLLFKLQ